jgi:outer membrane lipoprotein-sorting protein
MRSHNVENQIRELRFKASDTIRQSILSRVSDALEKKMKSQSAPTQPIIWRIIMNRPFTKLAVAAVVILAVVIGFHIGNPFENKAYAQVVEQLHHVRTLVFTLITQTNQGNGQTVKTDIAYKDPGLLRTTTVDGYIAVVDFTSGKMISIVPGGGYTLAEIKNLTISDAKGPNGPFASIESLKNLPAKADEKLGTKEIDGIVCDGYRVMQGDLAMTVWLDTKAGDLVQVEQKYASALGMNRIIKDIKFDVVLDDSLFSLTPPAGYKSGGIELKGDASAQKEETFIEFLRFWANATVDGTFPPIVAGSEIAKITVDMAQQGKFKGPDWGNAEAQKMFNGLLFVAHLPANSWRYAGNGVKFGEADKAIFWYRPKDSQMYRVIYGDLSVKDVAAENLPK